MSRIVPSFVLALLAAAGASLPAAAQTPSTAPTLEAQAASAALATTPEKAPEKSSSDKDAEGQPAAPPAPAPPQIPVTSGGTIGVYNKYLWRGFVLADEVSMQPTYWVKFGSSLTVSSWMNVARQQLEGPLTEHDLTVDYTKSVGNNFSISGGWINYVFPGLDSGSVSNEVYGGFSHASWLNPTVKVYVDFHAGKGTYVNFATSHSFGFGANGFAVTPSFAVGYNHKQWIDASAWSDANFGIALTIPTPFKQLSLAPSINYSKSLNDDNFDSHFIGGISLITKLF